MKIAAILTFVAILSATQVLAQGVISFGGGIVVRNPDGSLVTADQNYFGELYFAPDGTGTDQFNSFAVRVGNAGQVGVPIAGRLNAGSRTFPQARPGVSLYSRCGFGIQATERIGLR